MNIYPDQHWAGLNYTSDELREAKRQFDHPDEPSWGVYTIDGLLAVLADCDVTHAEEL